MRRQMLLSSVLALLCILRVVTLIKLEGVLLHAFLKLGSSDVHGSILDWNLVAGVPALSEVVVRLIVGFIVVLECTDGWRFILVLIRWRDIEARCLVRSAWLLETHVLVLDHVHVYFLVTFQSIVYYFVDFWLSYLRIILPYRNRRFPYISRSLITLQSCQVMCWHPCDRWKLRSNVFRVVVILVSGMLVCWV